MVDKDLALKGRRTAISNPETHFVLDTPIAPINQEGIETIFLALGCFWGAERLFWNIPGVVSTSVGYMGGYTENPTYEEVCSALTGHTEAVAVSFDPSIVSLQTILETFWSSHDPTQGFRQGNDVGTQYRSAIYTTSNQQAKAVEASRKEYQKALDRKGHGSITTEIDTSEVKGPYFLAETYHQQYLAKNPRGYCGIKGTGVACNLAAA